MRPRSPFALLLLATAAIILALALRDYLEPSYTDFALASDGQVELTAPRTSTPLGEPEALEGTGDGLASIDESAAEASTDLPTLNAAALLEETEQAVPLRSRPITQRRADLELTLDSLITLHVVSSSTGSPIEGVRVTVYLESPNPDELIVDHPTGTFRGSLGASARTDPRGFAELAVPSGKKLRLALVHEDGVGSRASHRLRALVPRETMELELPMARSGDQFFLRVVSRENGEPIIGCSAYFASENTPGSLHRHEPDALDSGDGLLILDIKPKSPDWAWVSAPGHGSTRVRIGPDHDQPAIAREVALPLECKMLVELLDSDGTPVPGVFVHLNTDAASVAAADQDARGLKSAKWITRTNEAGKAAFRHLLPDVPWTLEVQPKGDLNWDNPSPQILSGSEIRSLTLQRAPGLTLHGRLIPMRDVRIADLELWMLPANRQSEMLLQSDLRSRVWSKARTDAQGRFRILDIPPGEWWIGPAPQDSEISLGGPPPAPRAVWLRIPEGQAELAFDLEVHPALWLEGQVQTSKGFAAGRQRLWAKPIGGGDGLVGWSDSEGRFRIGPATAGTYEVAVDAAFAHAGSSPTVVDAGSDPIILRLRSGATIQGVAFDPKGLDLEPLSVIVTSTDGTLHRGDSLDVEGLPDGIHGLFVRSAAGRVGLVEAVSAKSGVPPTEVLVTLEEPAELHIKVFGQYRVWIGATCVGEGVAAQDAPLTLLCPAGRAKLERVEDGGPRTPIKLIAGQRLDFNR